ncbi:MAG: type II toxin-antitoxin system YafQ family toxin, partial [Parachlamydiales bacterium]
MLTAVYQNHFKKDLELANKRRKDINLLKIIIIKIINEESLLPKNKEHKLMGKYKGLWECHIEPDWLLIYKVTATEAIFVRT